MLGYLVLFSEIILPALSSWGIFVGENKCLDQGTVLLHGGEDEAGCPVCALNGLRSNRTCSMVTRSRHPLSRVVPSSLVSSIVTGTFPFYRKFARTSSLEIKRIFSKFHLI